ncbi:hypothetical protein HK105_201430 [Polyrhizophydium stewartii]|uniref:G-protein coupled receptors family 3 profile domain-containing protein n=1 Tax=Polyrhizophydium stewartii TaxID=2732419 RepID=A0ABR4NI67_9FUNG
MTAYRYLGIFGFMIGRHFSNMKALSRAYVNLQFLALCAVPIAALVCINAASPIVNHEMYSGSSSVLHFVCIASPTSSILLALAIAWIILLLAAALILAYITRTIPEEFNNSSKAATAVGLIALLSVFCLIQDSSGQFVQTQFIVEEASTAIGGLALFILLAVPTLQLSIVYHLANQQRVAPKTSRFGASSSRRISSYRRPISSGSGDGNQQPKQSTDRKMRLSVSIHQSLGFTERPSQAVRKHRVDIEVRPVSQELRLEMFKAQRGFLLRGETAESPDLHSEGTIC